MTDAIDHDELLRELTKRRAAKEHDRNLGSGFYRQGYIGGFYKQGYMDGYDDAIKAITIDSIPPAEVAPVRRGTWIEEEELWDDRYWTCSVCHESWCLTDDGTPEDHDMRYCPHCGAKMEDKKQGGKK